MYLVSKIFIVAEWIKNWGLPATFALHIKELKNPPVLYHDAGKLSSRRKTVEFNWSKKHVPNSTIYILLLFVDMDIKQFSIHVPEAAILNSLW